MKKKGVSLIALIITIVVIIIIAAAAIQRGIQRTDEAKLAKHNTNISAAQEEVENYYYYSGGELPIVNTTPYTILEISTLKAEIEKNGEKNDKFYVVDVAKLGKVSGDEGKGTGDDIYIVSATRHTVYYVKGITIKGVTCHGLYQNSNVKLAEITGGPTPTGEPTPTQTNTPTPTVTPTNTPIPTATPTPKCMNPIVPTGFNHVSGTWDNGYTIQDAKGNQFIWVPVDILPADGTLDGIAFNSKFGRRNFRSETFGLSDYNEINDATFQDMVTSVGTYGGFYIARYEMSNNSYIAESKPNVKPWAALDWNTARLEAESMDSDSGWNVSAVESCLCYGAHWDTALKWINYTGAKSLNDIKVDSISWGNYNNDSFSGETTVISYTGKWSQTSANGIFDLAGDLSEWTMENYSSANRVIRGGSYAHSGSDAPAAYRYYALTTDYYASVGFRVVLYVK